MSGEKLLKTLPVLQAQVMGDFVICSSVFSSQFLLTKNIWEKKRSLDQFFFFHIASFFL